MLEVVEKPFALKQALHKVEIALAVLGNVAVRFERLAYTKFVLGQRAKSGEHFTDNSLDRFFFLKNACIEAASQHPQPRP